MAVSEQDASFPWTPKLNQTMERLSHLGSVFPGSNPALLWLLVLICSKLARFSGVEIKVNNKGLFSVERPYSISFT